MFQTFLQILIFFLVLFVYINICYHLKKSNDLEIYTIHNPSKYKLEEICNLRQPVIFTMPSHELTKCKLSKMEDNYNVFDIKIRNLEKINTENDIYLPLKLSNAIKLIQNDKELKYLSENNEDFLNETLAINVLKYNDAFLRPPLLSKCIYDYIIGGQTPLRYDLNFRNFYYVSSGSVNIKLVPPHYKKHLNVHSDYEKLEFRSPLNLWDIQADYKDNYDKIKVLDVTLNEGDFIYIPAYWFYSIKFNGISSVCVFKYLTFMNTISILPQLFMNMLQLQNMKHSIVSTFNENILMKNNGSFEENKKINQIKSQIMKNIPDDIDNKEDNDKIIKPLVNNTDGANVINRVLNNDLAKPELTNFGKMHNDFNPITQGVNELVDPNISNNNFPNVQHELEKYHKETNRFGQEKNTQGGEKYKQCTDISSLPNLNNSSN